MSIIKAIIASNVPLKSDAAGKDGDVVTQQAFKEAYDVWANGFEQHIKDAVKDRVRAVASKELSGKPLTKAIREQVLGTINTIVDKM